MQGIWIKGAVGVAFAFAAVAVPANAAITDPHVPGEVIVQFAPGASGAERDAARDEAGTEALEGLGSRGLQLVEITGDASVAETIRELEADPAVRFAEPNGIEQPSAVPNDPSFPSLWGLLNAGQTVNGAAGTPDADIDAPEAWDIEAGNPETVVAIMDSGADLSHPDLAPQLWQNPGEVAGNGVDDDANGFVDDVNGYDFVDEDSVPSTSTAHGTHVAGTALARGDDGFGISGVSQRGSLMVLKVCNGQGCSQAAQIRAINYAAAEGANVLNGSLGGFSTIENVSRRAAIFSHPETLFVFAAGNETANSDNQPSECGGASPCIAYPCAHAPAPGEVDNTLCVAATTPTDNRASFSNFGATSVDLGAPGTSTLSDSAFRRRFFDNFNAFAWTGPGAPAQPNWVLASGGIEEVAGNYVVNTTYRTISPEFALPPGSGECQLNYFRSRDLDPDGGDIFRIEVLRNGLISPARTFEFTTDSAGANVSIDLGDTLVAGGAIRIRLSLIADAANGGSVGVHMDNIELRCAESPSDNGFLFLQGTSMAAPHVAGAAGLLFSRNAGAGAAEIRDKLLSTVDPNAALSGITTTGGRLNIGTAMARMPADTAITGGPGEGEVIGGRRSARGRSSPPGAFASFGVASNDPAAGFQCSVDGAAFAACGAGGTATVGPLGPGPHSFAVRSVDPRGNADTTPATRAFAVETDPPETRIVKGPKKRTTARKAKFRFRSDEPGSTFECKYDRKPFKPCTSPRKLKRVKVGRHKFLVRATDGVGNVDTSAAKKRWRVKK